MKHIVESVDAMYGRREPWGEVILDGVVDVLRRTNVYRPQDVALLLEVGRLELGVAVKMLTGMTLVEIIEGWRLRQAKELLTEAGFDFGKPGFLPQLPQKELLKVARRCGLNNVRSLQHFLQRHQAI